MQFYRPPAGFLRPNRRGVAHRAAFGRWHFATFVHPDALRLPACAALTQRTHDGWPGSCAVNRCARVDFQGSLTRFVRSSRFLPASLPVIPTVLPFVPSFTQLLTSFRFVCDTVGVFGIGIECSQDPMIQHSWTSGVIGFVKNSNVE